MIPQLEKWNRGEFTYSKPEENLMKLESGEKIGNTLSACTICPVGNTTCANYFTIIVAGFHPEKKMEKKEIIVCPAGIQDVDNCPLKGG